MIFLEKIWDWLVWSSADSEKVSLAVKGALGGFVVVLLVAMNLVHVQIPGLPDQLNAIVDALVALVQTALAFISAVSFVVGVIRKIWLTFTGSNQAIS